MSLHSHKIVKTHRLIESVSGISEPVRVGAHMWVAHMQMKGLADCLSYLNKRSLCAIEQVVSGGAIDDIVHIIPYFPQQMIYYIKFALMNMNKTLPTKACSNDM